MKIVGENAGSMAVDFGASTKGNIAQAVGALDAPEPAPAAPQADRRAAANGEGAAFNPANDDKLLYGKMAQTMQEPSRLPSTGNWVVFALSFALLVASQFHLFGFNLSILGVPAFALLFAGFWMLAERRHKEQMDRILSLTNDISASMNKLGDEAPNRLFDAARTLRSELSYMEQTVDGRMRHMLQFSAEVKGIIRETDGLIEKEAAILSDVRNALDSTRKEIGSAASQFSVTLPQFHAMIKETLGAGIAQIEAQTPKVVSDLAASAEGMQGRLVRALENAHEVFQKHTDAQALRLEGQVVKVIEAASDDLTQKMRQQVEKLTGDVTAEKTALLKNVSGLVGDVARAIAANSEIVTRLNMTEMPSLVGQLSAIERKISSNITGVIPEAVSSLGASASKFEAKISEARADLKNVLDGEVQRVKQDIATLMAKSVETMSSKIDSADQAWKEANRLVEARLGESNAFLDNRLADHASKLQSTVEAFDSGFERTINEKLEGLSQRSDANVRTLEGVFAAQGENIDKVFSERAANLYARMDQIIKLADETLAGRKDELVSVAERFDGGIKSASSSLLESIHAVNSDIFERVQLVERELETFSATSEKAFARRADKFLEDINKKLETIESLFSDGSRSITDAMLGHAGHLIKALRESVGNFDDIFNEQIEKIKTAVALKEGEVINSTESRVGSAVERLNESHKNAENLLDSRLLLVEFVISEFTKKLENIDATVDQKISGSAKAAVDAIGFHTDLVLDAVKAELGRMEQLLGPENPNLTELPQRLKEIIMQTEMKIFEAESTFAHDAANFSQKIDQISSELAASMRSNMSEAEERTLMKVQDLAQSLDKMFERVHSGLDLRATKFGEVMSRHAVEINRTIVDATNRMENLRGPTGGR